MRLLATLLIILITFSCDWLPKATCSLSSITFQKTNPNQQAVISMTRRLDGRISRLHVTPSVYLIHYDDQRITQIQIVHESANNPDVEFDFLHSDQQIVIDKKLLDFPNGAFDTKIILTKDDEENIIRKEIIYKGQQFTSHETFSWGNGNITRHDFYFNNSLHQSYFYTYDTHPNPLKEFGHIFILPELATKNNIVTTSSDDGPIDNYQYVYNASGLPVNYALPPDLGGHPDGLLHYTTCD